MVGYTWKAFHFLVVHGANARCKIHMESFLLFVIQKSKSFLYHEKSPVYLKRKKTLFANQRLGLEDACGVLIYI